MKNSKKGISLIVLVITIIVIIILAAAVLLSLQNNNPIQNSKNATYANDKAEIKSSIALFIGNYMSSNNGASPFQETEPTASTKITISGNDKTDRSSLTGTNRNVLSWGDLGMSKPSSIETCSYDIYSGVLTATSANGATEN